MYILAQIFGILVAVSCTAAPVFKKKWQILAVLLFGNICASLNFLLLNGFGSAVIINLLATVHISVNMIHECRGKYPNTIEKIIFFLLYIGCGLIGYRTILDLLPIVAAVFFMLSVFQKKEQSIRICNTLNATTWIIYDCIVGSSAIVAQLLAIISNVASFIKYRRDDKS